MQVTTDEQNQGRGRMNSKWNHGEGNIACSFGFKMDNSPNIYKEYKKLERYRWVPYLISSSIVSVLGEGYKLKWPNDIYSTTHYNHGEPEPDDTLSGNWKKVCGSKVDAEMYQDGRTNSMILVVGFGINTTSYPTSDGQFTKLRTETFETFENDNDLLINKIVENFDESLESLINDLNYVRAMENIIEKFDENLLWKDRLVKVTSKDNEDSIYNNIEGRLMGLNQFGGINIQTMKDAFVPVKELMSLHLLEDQTPKF